MLPVAVAAGLSGCRGGRVYAAAAAESRSVRKAAAAWGGGEVWRGRAGGTGVAWSFGGHPERPRFGVWARRVSAVPAWWDG